MAWKKTDTDNAKRPLVSHTGVVLSRPTTFRFELDPTDTLEQRLWMFAGARRFTFNHHVGRVKSNLAARATEQAAGLGRSEMTPSLSWSKQSFINSFNAWKNGTATDSPVNDDGTRGLAWRDEIAADVFECASVDAAQALADYKASVSGARAGLKVGFPTSGPSTGTDPGSGCAPSPSRVRPHRSGSSTRPASACPNSAR
jgi:putative transposase